MRAIPRFSALQRAEIAEIVLVIVDEAAFVKSFSALQRAEIAEISTIVRCSSASASFSALQRAEIAEIQRVPRCEDRSRSKFQCSSTSRNC